MIRNRVQIDLEDMSQAEIALLIKSYRLQLDRHVNEVFPHLLKDIETVDACHNVYIHYFLGKELGSVLADTDLTKKIDIYNISPTKTDCFGSISKLKQ